jgi:MYXO-CTERM domain-containing protein
MAAGCACALGGDGGSRGHWILLALGVGFVLVGRTRRARPAARPSFVAPVLLAFAALLALTGCLPDQPTGTPPTDWSKLGTPTAPDPELAALGIRQQTIDRVCARRRGDPFAQALCAGPRRPEIRHLAELLQLVALADQRAFALVGTSTSLSTRSVSAINPRVLVFPRVGPDLRRPDKMTVLAFVRGEQAVELVSRDPSTGELNFYLLSFEHPCSTASAGCDLASLLTEEIEHGWTAYSVYDHEDLEKTSLDCLSCHQPGGQGTKRILRMQELASPWLHWFPQRYVQRTESDRVLLAQFAEAHGGEKQYGGVPVATIMNALDEGSAAQLEALVRAEGSAEQPNPFDAQIVTEMKSGSSGTWAARFEMHLRGQAIAVPYPGMDVSDPVKRAAAIRSYQYVVRGAAPRASLLDLREVLSADAIEKLSLVPKPGADGKTAMLQMCARCHDGRGNPQLGKNRFNVLALDRLTPGQKQLAITRLGETGPKRMPPWRVGTLTSESIQAMTAELQK